MGIVYLKFEYNWGILLINLATIPTLSPHPTLHPCRNSGLPTLFHTSPTFFSLCSSQFTGVSAFFLLRL